MAHINSRGAAIFSDFQYSNNAASYTPTQYNAAFATGTLAGFETTLLPLQDDSGGTDAVFTDIPNLSSLPANIGVPPSITSEGEFGVNNAPQIRTQGESPTLEFGIRFIPSEHEALEALVNDGIVRLFRIRFFLSEIPDAIVADTRHSNKYWLGQVAGFTATGSFSAGSTATLTVTAETDFSRYLTTV